MADKRIEELLRTHENLTEQLRARLSELGRSAEPPEPDPDEVRELQQATKARLAALQEERERVLRDYDARLDRAQATLDRLGGGPGPRGPRNGELFDEAPRPRRPRGEGGAGGAPAKPRRRQP